MEQIMASFWPIHSNNLEDELVRELLDDESPLFVQLPELAATTESETAAATRSTEFDGDRVSKLIVSSAAYSGPTIEDIENALSFTPRKELSPAGFSMLEKGLSKIEHKYTLRIKSCGNLVADDGYKWRKYGQKSIKNSPNPRSYYRCSNPRCSAKKQVERSIEDSDTFIITYEGLHLHFAYPFFVMAQTQQAQSPTKKPKKTDSETQAPEPQKSPKSLTPRPQPLDGPEESAGPQGLLEDMVPLMIRNPSSNKSNGLSNSSSCSSYRSPPITPSSPPTRHSYIASCF